MVPRIVCGVISMGGLEFSMHASCLGPDEGAEFPHGDEAALNGHFDRASPQLCPPSTLWSAATPPVAAICLSENVSIAGSICQVLASREPKAPQP